MVPFDHTRIRASKDAVVMEPIHQGHPQVLTSPQSMRSTSSLYMRWIYALLSSEWSD